MTQFYIKPGYLISQTEFHTNYQPFSEFQR
jgi:hypothetical protein